MTETNTPPWQQEHPDYDGWVAEYGGKVWGEVGEILFQVGLEDWSNRIHDWTIPAHETGTGRG